MKVDIENISWEHYPRIQTNQQQIELYRQSLDQLPPILISPDKFGIDGKHRCEAYRQEGKSEIEVEVLDIPEDEVLIESIKRNATHGLQLSNKDKRRMAVRLYTILKDIDAITELLSVSSRSVLNWTKKLREEEQNEEDRIIWDMWLACKSQEEIAGVIKLERSIISDRIVGLRKNAETHNSPEPLKKFNVWNFPSCDERFGIKYPGRIPGQILEHLLYYYTEPFDVVMDLFGGGGVTVDVCKHMARRYRVYDFKPVREDIQKHDATTGIPAGRPKPKLIFLDPPYWQQQNGNYPEGITNLANMPLEEFYDALTKITNECIEYADYTALIVGGGEFLGRTDRGLDHAMELNKRVNGKLIQRVIVPYTTQNYSAFDISRATKDKVMLNLFRDLLIWEKNG